MYCSILLNQSYESLELMKQCEKNFMLGFEHGIKNNDYKNNIITRAEFCKKFNVNNSYLKFIKNILSNKNIDYLKNLRQKVKCVSGQEKVSLYRMLKSKQRQLHNAFYIYFYFTVLVHTADFSAQYFIDLYDYIYDNE